MSQRQIRVRVEEQIPDNVSRSDVGAYVVMNDDKMKEMILSNPNILVLVERMREFMAIGQCNDDFRERMQLMVLRSCVEITFMAGLIIKHLEPKGSIGHEIPLTFGSKYAQSLYSRNVTTPSIRAIGILKVNEGDKCLFIYNNTWETLSSKVLRMLNGSDLETKALVLAMTKRCPGEFLKRWVQSFMLGDQESIAKNAVTSCSTYDALVEVCHEIKAVLDSNLTIEQQSDRIFHELSTFISEYGDDPYESTRPKDDLWRKETGRHVRDMIESDRKTLRESPKTKILHFMEYQFYLQMPDEERMKYFSNPIDLFDINPHLFVAHLHQIKVGDDQYINVIVLGCSYFTPFAIKSHSRPTTRIANSACLAAVTNVLAHAGIVEQEVSNRVTALFRTFGTAIEGHGTVDRPEGSVPAACQQTIPAAYCTNPWKRGASELANILMRKHGVTHTLTPVGNRLHLQFAATIIQILGIKYTRMLLHNIHGITVGDDYEAFLESMQLQGVKNAHKRYRKQGIKKNLTTAAATAASVTAAASTRKRKHDQLCGFEGWCVNKVSTSQGNNCCCSLHFIDDSSGEPLAKLQSERYIEVCDPEVRLYNEQRDQSIVFRNIFAVTEWCATHKFGQKGNEKGITTRRIIPEDIINAGPNGLLVERMRGLPQGYDGKWIWTLTGRLTHTTPSSVTYFERDQNGNYHYVETIYDYQVGRMARLSSLK